MALLAALAWALISSPPDTVFHLFGRTLGPADVVHRLIRRGLTLGLLLPALFAIELAIEGWRESSLRQLLIKRPRSAWSDAAVFLFWNTPVSAGATAVLSLGAVLLPAAWLHRTLANAVGASIELGGWPLPLQVVGFCFVCSFFDYWQHRLDHTAQFWPLHRFHHAARDFCVLTSVRVHPGGVGITGVVGAILPAMLVGVSEPALFWYATAVGMHRFLIHTRIKSDFGWIGRWVIQSPLHHRQHHKLDMSEPTSNYGLAPIWDRVFGTWAEIKDPRVPIGVATPYRHGAWIIPDLLRDYRDFWLAVAGAYRDQTGAPLAAKASAASRVPVRSGMGSAHAMRAFATVYAARAHALEAAEEALHGAHRLEPDDRLERLGLRLQTVGELIDRTGAREPARPGDEALVVVDADRPGLSPAAGGGPGERRADDPLGA